MHRFVPDGPSPVDPSPTAAEEAAALKRWTQRALHLGPDTVVSVHTTHCVDAGCPVSETTIVVQTPGAPARGWRFQRPRVALSRVVVAQVLATPGFVIAPRDSLPATGTAGASGAPGPPPPSGR